MVTLYDVARHAGVSIATVSRVLHGPDAVRETTRAKVRSAIEELGYVPDSAAQSLARNRKDVIGLVCVEHSALRPGQHDIESMSLVFYEEVMRGVEAVIRERSWSLLITFVHEAGSPDGLVTEGGAVESRLLALCGKVDGLLICEGIVSPDTLARLARRVPLVVVAGDTTQRGADVVAADNWSGAHALTEHLIADHGRRRLFHVDGPASAPDAQARRVALQSVIDAHPGAELAGAWSGQFSVSSGEEGGRHLLAACTPAPDAIVCANDQMAIGVLRALGERGIRVPEDIAVVGFDDIFPASLCDPPLTTVHQPIGLIGERACDRLIELIADPSLPGKVELLATELVLRSSCGCPKGTTERRPVKVIPVQRKATAGKKPGGPPAPQPEAIASASAAQQASLQAVTLAVPPAVPSSIER